MKKSKIAILALAPALLCSCATKCDFAKYKEKVEAIKAPEKTLVAIEFSAKVKSDDMDDINDKLRIECSNFVAAEAQLLKAMGSHPAGAVSLYSVMLSANAASFVLAGENEHCTYYAGSTFKVVEKVDDSKTTYVFDKYGYCVKMTGSGDGSKGTVTAKYCF